jgi:hypothetical protein
VYIVTELLKGGELLEALLERGAYSERDARTIFRPILEGIAYLHAKRITHRDLKLENLLLADKGDLSSVRIADFGLAKAVFDSSDDPHAMRAVCGTPAYVAPEIITRRVYTPAVDLWSAGVILYILLSGVVPFEDQDEKRLFAKISRGAYSLNGPEWVAVSSEAKRLVAGLMCLDPARRLTAAAALEHNWFLRASRKLPPSVTASQKEMDDAKEEEAAAVPLPSAAGGLAAFAARIKLPVQQFPAGSHIIHRGERATHVYLIRSGTCALVLEPEAHEEPQPHEGGSTPDDLGQGVKLLGRRGAGDFVGETGVVMDARGRLILPRSAAGETGAGGGLLDSPGPVTPKSPPSPHAGEPSGGNKWCALCAAGACNALQHTLMRPFSQDGGADGAQGCQEVGGLKTQRQARPCCAHAAHVVSTSADAPCFSIRLAAWLPRRMWRLCCCASARCSGSSTTTRCVDRARTPLLNAGSVSVLGCML